MLKKGLFLLGVVGFLFCGGCNKTEEIVNCNFDNSSMGQVEQKECQEKITKFIDELCKYNDGINEVSIYISDTVSTKYQEEVMYINTEEVNEIDTFFRMFYHLNGLEMNAGEAYGFTVQIYEECNIGAVEDKYTIQGIKDFFSSSERLYLLDFTFPMMESHYFDEEMVAYVRSAANLFVAYCVDEYGKEKAYQYCVDESAEGHNWLAELKNAWLASIGVEETYTEYAKLPFEQNDTGEVENYPYVIRGESVNWYFSPLDVKEEGYHDFVKAFLEVEPVAEVDFAEAREVLKKYISQTVESVDVFTHMCESNDGVERCIYNHDENRIGVYTNWTGLKQCLLHEYIHYLTVGKNKLFNDSLGLVEGVTDALASLVCENRLEEMYYADALSDEVYGKESYEYVKEIGALKPGTNEVNGEIYYYYEAKKHYELEPQTHKYYAVLWKMTSKPYTMTLGALSYPEAGSMAKYLIEQYGMDEVLTHCENALEIEELTGKTFLELYEVWGAWNEQRYQEIKIN